jgi:hypothetical protein
VAGVGEQGDRMTEGSIERFHQYEAGVERNADRKGGAEADRRMAMAEAVGMAVIVVVVVLVRAMRRLAVMVRLAHDDPRLSRMIGEPLPIQREHVIPGLFPASPRRATASIWRRDGLLDRRPPSTARLTLARSRVLLSHSPHASRSVACVRRPA